MLFTAFGTRPHIWPPGVAEKIVTQKRRGCREQGLSCATMTRREMEGAPVYAPIAGEAIPPYVEGGNCKTNIMPEKNTLERARRDKEQGKAATTQAGEFVREEIHHIREGKHGARSSKQAIAIGLSKARRSGVGLPAPPKGRASEKTRRSAGSAYRKGQKGLKQPSKRRSKARLTALKREGKAAASHRALSRQARQAAGKRRKMAEAR
jgi:hypothetical protein